MAVDTKHPEYASRAAAWQKLSDCYKGEDVIKQKGTDYLSPTEGMQIDGMGDGQLGRTAFLAYVNRAVYHNFVHDAVEAMVGIMHREEARIVVPTEMEDVVQRFTINGESLQMTLRRMNEWQLLYGRAGILLEVPTGQPVNKARPFAALYAGPAITNWDDGTRAEGEQKLEFVILDESGYVRVGDYEWELQNSWRVCQMSGNAAKTGQEDQDKNTATGQYQVGITIANGATVDPNSVVTPSLGGKTLDRIPFVFVNTKDLVSSTDDPPLLGLANLSLAIYRAEADYRQTLYLQGQDTFVVTGSDTEKPLRVGAGAQINLPMGATAKYEGITALGLVEMKGALNDDKTAASEMTSKLFDSTGTSYQSGEALRIRVSAKTATLTSIARTSGEAIREVLVLMAQWMGLSESKQKEIIVEPNTDFAETMTASRTALELTQAKTMGMPLSQKSLHRFAVKNDLTELTFEQEIAEIKGEDPLIAPTAQGIGGQAGGILGRATGGSRVPRGAASDTPPSKAPAASAPKSTATK